MTLLSLPGAGLAQEPGRKLPEIPRLRELSFTFLTDDRPLPGEERTAQITALIKDATVLEVQAALTAGTVTSEELTGYFLNRIRRQDGLLRSYMEVNPRCLEEARAADRLRKEGKVLGPLHGIPLNVKDNIGTAAPMHTTAGAEILLQHAPARDAVLVKQLRDAGAVILGKASMSELAGVLTTKPAGYNAVSGIGVNPHGRQLPVSGSSSGSGISVSACLTMLSVGTETSGSLISPAAANGVVAMKPSLGLVSGEGIVPLIRYQDSAGPVTRSVTDAAVLLAALDMGEADYAVGLDAGALNGVSVGVLRQDITGPGNPGRHAGWLALMDEGLGKAKAVSRGVTLEGKIELLPVIFLGLSHDTIGYLAEAGAPVKTLADLQAYNAAKPEIRIPRGQNMIELGSQVMAAFYKEDGIKEDGLAKAYEDLALKARESATAILANAFAGNSVQVLVSLANTHSELYATAGYPAITVPLGVNKDGVPNGITFIGQRGEDAKLLAYAFAFEQATRSRVTPAAVWKD